MNISGLHQIDTYAHRVQRVAAVSGVGATDKIGQDDTAKAGRATNSAHERPQISARARYDANSAAAGFAAHILAQSGAAGSDPHLASRRAKAFTFGYSGPIFLDTAA